MMNLKRKSVLFYSFLLLFLLFSFTGCTQMEADSLPLTPTEAVLPEQSSAAAETGIFAESLEPLTVHYLNVGQGDCTLITQGDHSMLIDAGANDQGTKIQHYLDTLDIQTLDYVILTHPDADHIGSADVILYKYDCENILMPDMTADTKVYDDVMQTLKEKGYTSSSPTVGDSCSLGNASFTILSPAGDYENTNDNSIVIHLTHGDISFLFTGDAEYEAESAMISSGQPIHADVLKVGHHGSSSSTSEAFLKAVNPFFAVISCGLGNDYGHPHRETLTLLEQAKIPVYRTDEQGTITVTSDGVSLDWKISRNSILSEENTAAPSYIVNASSGKIHLLDCEKVAEMSELNRDETNLSLEELMDMGYDPCRWCMP